MLICCLPLTGTTYTAKKGDTLYSIAHRYGVSISTLCALNNVSQKTYRLKAGMKLTVPASEPIVKPAPKIAAAAPAPAAQSIPPPEKKPAEVPEQPAVHVKEKPHAASSVTFRWPCRGEIIGNFGLKNSVMHTGIDIKADNGATVVCARDGIVEFTGTIRGYGNVVIVKHEGEYNSIYGNLAQIKVTKGDTVTAGNELGTLGVSEMNAAPSLYFKICQQGKPKDPLPLLSSI